MYDCIFVMLMVILFLKFKHMNHRAVTPATLRSHWSFVHLGLCLYVFLILMFFLFLILYVW
ncbi:hypothetical protein D7I40_18385 [Citrobacter sp. MH181794]|nr:hypothetical protein D7I40_18385 [Citrobacter sp. MH181794]